MLPTLSPGKNFVTCKTSHRISPKVHLDKLIGQPAPPAKNCLH